MIRERVDIKGEPRPMESREELSVLRLKPSEVGIIKEAPTIRWLKGQEEWDVRYRQSAEKAIRQRRKNEAKAKILLDNARQQGLVLVSDPGPELTSVVSSTSAHATGGVIQEERRWGPLDLEHERPPPTAIAKRRDTVRPFKFICFSLVSWLTFSTRSPMHSLF